VSDKLRCFNDDGIEEFRRVLKGFHNKTLTEFPHKLLSDERFAYVLGDLRIKSKQFQSKLDVAIYLGGLVGEIRGMNPTENPYENVGLWTWLSAYYFDQVCPKKTSGGRKIGACARHILTLGWGRYNRHLLAVPVRMYETHKENSMILLASPLDEMPDIVEQLMNRQDVALNKSVIGAANTLYWDKEKSEVKYGVSLTEHKPGTVRRFVDVILQLDETYDLYSMKSSDILDILPDEFRNFPK